MKKLFVLFISLFMIAALGSCALLTDITGDNNELTLESVYLLAKENGYEGSVEDFINEFKGDDGEKGADGIGIRSVTVNSTGHLIIEYTDDTKVNAGLVIFTPDYEKITPSIGDNGNWYIGGNDTGVPANSGEVGSQWYTGTAMPAESLGSNGDFYISTSTLNVYYKDGVWSLVGSVRDSGTVAGSSEMTQAAISRALLSSVSVFCEIGDGTGAYQTGSGVIYKLDKASGDAYIITNHHVVYNEETSSIIADSDLAVYLYGLEYESYAIPVSYVGGSSIYDIAVLKASESVVIKESNARSAVVADSDKLSVLDSVIAVGNPLGGGISATRGVLNVESEYVDTKATTDMRVMRVDVPINEGNSGGGLFNTNGELIGIVDAKIIDAAVDNIGYVIPSNNAVRLVENILYFCDGTANKNGKTVTFGIQLSVVGASVKYDEQTEKLVNVQTVAIKSVTSGSAAAVVGLAAGDKILSITVDGTEYAVTKLYHPVDIRLLLRPGISVVYKVERGGAVLTKTLTMPDLSHFKNIE